jgi:hypothetical protein
MDWIQGERFITMADFAYAPKEKHKWDFNHYPNTLNLSELKEGSVIYTHMMYAEELFKMLSAVETPVVVVSHNGDENVADASIMPSNVIKWFTQNVDVKDERIESIPIGLENNRWFPHLRKKENIEAKTRMNRKIKNLVYLNCNINTNISKRKILYDLFKDKSWVTAELGRNNYRFNEYIDNIYSHNFVLCPQGNGIDTHRTWETLYLGSIPIQKRDINNSYNADLPIVFVDDWHDINRNFLEKEYIRIKSSEWNMDKLTFEYWRDRIFSFVPCKVK